MGDEISVGLKVGRDIVLQISRSLHGHGLTFDDKLDLLGEISDYCEGKIQETWDESLEVEDEVGV